MSEVNSSSGIDGAATVASVVLPTGVPVSTAQKYRHLGLWKGQTHWEFFCESVQRHGDMPAIRDAHRALTYRQLQDSVEQISSALAVRGICTEQTVVVQLPNSIVFLEVVLALFRLGAVPVFALPSHGSLEVQHFCRIAEAAAYVGPAHVQSAPHVADALRSDQPSVRIIEIDVAGDNPWAMETASHPVDPAVVSADSLAFLQLSGGTTAIPKLIPRTHDDYLYSVRCSVEICDLRAGDTMMIVLPCAHNFTMSSPGILGAIHAGAQIVIAADPSPTTCLKTIEQYQVTQAALVPPLLLSWLNAPTLAQHDIGSLRTLWVGGAKLSDTVARRVSPELGCQLQQVFGMAEGLVNYTRLTDDLDTVATTQGRPLSEYDEIRILDDEGNPVAVGENGLLYTRGPYTIRQYYRAPEHNARSFTDDGFYCTGDIVRQLETGHLMVVGRDKDQINRGGEKIAPEALENELLAHECVHDVSVVGLPDDILGERICAYVIPRFGHAEHMPTMAEFRTFLRERGLAPYALPDVLRIVDRFPHTGVGKISKKDQRL